MMQKHPNMRIELGGHTDNVGRPEANQKLSEQRAKAVYDYLVKKGISADRLTYKGYGQTEPVADNTTPEGRRQNRRTVFTILEK
jgi:outer membrane protein OmpA-like peptidoglycan-associated protein